MSLAPSIEAFSFDFKFYIFPYVLHLIPFVDHLIPSVCDVPSLPICLICNAPLCCIFVESVLQVCKSRCLAPLICVFDLHLWVLCLVLLALCLALFCTPSITCIVPLPCVFDFLYLLSRLQMSTLISCIFVFYLCPALPTPILHLWLACFKPTFYVFHHHLAPLNAELKYLHYTQCGHCCSCQHAYAIQASLKKCRVIAEID